MKEAVNWESIERYRFVDFYKTIEGIRPRSVELKNKEIILFETWIERIKNHIQENNNQHLYEALKEYWSRYNETPEISAYKSYANKSFNNPIWAGYDEFKKRGLNIKCL